MAVGFRHFFYLFPNSKIVLDISPLFHYYMTVANLILQTGCGSVWLERHLREVEAAGSNPVTPIGFLSNLRNPFFNLVG